MEMSWQRYTFTLRFKELSEAVAAHMLKFLRGNEKFYLPSWKNEFRLEKEYIAGNSTMVLEDDRTHIPKYNAGALAYRINSFSCDVGQRRRLIHLSKDGVSDVFSIGQVKNNILDVSWLTGDKAEYPKGATVNFCGSFSLQVGNPTLL